MPTLNYNRGQRLYIRELSDDGKTDGRDIVGGVPLLLASEVNLRLNTTYGEITKVSTPVGLQALLSSIKVLSDNGLTGAFANQGFQVWQKTDPIEFSFAIEIRMQTSGYKDVIYPAQQLMRVCLPELAPNGWGLIPPGPSLVKALGKDLTGDNSWLNKGDSLYSIRIGSYFYFKDCVITQVVPTYSKAVDTDGHAISAKVEVTMRTTAVATKGMIEGMTGTGGK